jgi:hypothetical protein
MSTAFRNARHYFARYAWPAEFVVRALKELGYVGFSVNDALTPMINMGQQLFEPPDVNGWAIGPAWFSTGAMLARMNFASQLASNQRFELRNAARSHGSTPDSLLTWALGRFTLPVLPTATTTVLRNYVTTSAWTGSDTQLLNKAGGLCHLLAGSGEYQFV